MAHTICRRSPIQFLMGCPHPPAPSCENHALGKPSSAPLAGLEVPEKDLGHKEAG